MREGNAARGRSGAVGKERERAGGKKRAGTATARRRRGRGTRRGFRSLVAGGATVIALVNVVQFGPLEREAGSYYAAVSPHGSAQLKEIVEGHMSTTRSRFLMYLELEEVTDEPTIVMFDGSGLHKEELYAFADAKRVVEAEYDNSISPQQARSLRDKVVRRGEQREVGRYAIVVGRGARPEGEGQLLVAVTSGETLYLVEERLLPAGVWRGRA